ncbi:hypothetical protein J2848_005711 [Azospirillum lipoferum]|uniref:Uncharacterized protein n=1 Tax=Azospirillum lipoferum TaxID=193 RepID=A0A5A9GEZ3_AZOLI|nr:hypothetical protein FZ942_25760 [Azospirillum lipoferum]MCP1614010.1 hypothetical protein [Azospirillum lipoferum]
MADDDITQVVETNPLDTPQVRSPNQPHEKGELGEHVAAVAIQKAFPGYRLVPSKADGITGPDQVWVSDDPTKPVLIIEVKTIDGSSMTNNPTRYLKKTKSGRQGSQEYVEKWAHNVINGRKAQ